MYFSEYYRNEILLSTMKDRDFNYCFPYYQKRIITKIIKEGSIKHRTAPYWYMSNRITKKLAKQRIFSLLRHLIKFLLNPFSRDKESKELHLYHILTNCMIIIHYYEKNK